MPPRLLTIIIGCAAVAAVCHAADSVEPPASPIAAGTAMKSAAQVAAQLDALMAADWKANGVIPARGANDATFLRRAWLDLAGVTPPVDQVSLFLADRRPERRAALVESLLASQEFNDHWGGVLTSWAIDRRPLHDEHYDGRVLHGYLRGALQANLPYDEIVRTLITAEGSSDQNGPANFLLRYDAQPTDLAGAVSRQFLGLSLQCAQCHNHPFAKWTEADFWGLAACFGRLNILEGSAQGQTVRAIHESRRGDLERPDMEAALQEDGQRPTKKIPPRLPGGLGVAGKNRREALANWLTATDNPYFARQTVNRVWEQFFGHRLFKSFDDLESVSGSQRGRILDLLAADFKASGHDLKRLMRAVTLGRTYQLASGDEPAEGADAAKSANGTAETTGRSERSQTAVNAAQLKRLEHFAIYPVKPLSVDQLYQSIARGTGHIGYDEEPEASDSGDAPTAEPGEASGQIAAGDAKAGSKLSAPAMSADHKKQPALAMAAPTMGGAMRAQRDLPAAKVGAAAASDDEEMSNDTTDWPGELLGERGLTLQRTLTMENGEFVHDAVQSGAKLAVAMRGARGRNAQIEWLFQATLSRPPAADEMATMLQLQQASKGVRGLEDVLWALLNSAEFNSNH